MQNSSGPDEQAPATPPAPEPQPTPQPQPTPAAPERDAADRRGGVSTAGVVLIMVGAVMLAVQFLPGLTWWNWWPLVIVIAGLVQAFTPGHRGWSVDRMFDGFVTCTIGLVFLAMTTGYASWTTVGTILSLWPVLLISIGLNLLGKSMGAEWPKVLASLVVIGALIYALATTAAGGGPILWTTAATTGEKASISEPVRGVDEASLLVQAGAARTTLGSGSQLIEAQGTSPWGTPEFSVTRSGSDADVTLSLGEADGVVVIPGAPGGELDAQLSDAVKWDVEVQTGAATLEADLSDVEVSTLQLKPGFATCDVKLGDPVMGQGESSVLIKAGLSTIDLAVPQDAEFRVESSSGLSGVSIEGANKLSSGVWETAGFADAKDADKPVWVIRLESGLASFTLDRY